MQYSKFVCTASFKKAAAFTLIELMVVMGIMALLGGMLFVMIGEGDAHNDKLEMELLISRIGSGLDQYETLNGSVALPTGERADPTSGTWYPGDTKGSWEKQALWWRLGTSMSKEQIADAKAYAKDQDIVADPYQNGGYWAKKYPALSGWERVKHRQAAMNAVIDDDADFYKGRYTGSWASVSAEAISYGSTGDISGPSDNNLSNRGKIKAKVLRMRAKIARDLAVRAWQTNEILERGEIGETFLQDDVIIDIWGNPLIYVAHSTIGVPYAYPWNHNTGGLIKIGAEPEGRAEIADRNQDGQVDDLDWSVAPSENEKHDWNKDGDMNEQDWSNILYNARPGKGRNFYVASAGEDGLFDCIRPSADNADNIESE